MSTGSNSLNDVNGVIRPATEQDGPRLLELMAMAAFPPGRDVTEGDLELPHMQRWFAYSREAIDLVHEAEGVVNGAVWARVVEPQLWSVGGMPVPEIAIAVAPDARGRGLGATLLDALHPEAAKRHWSHLCLAVSPLNEACRLYARRGYEKVDERSGRWIMVAEVGRE